MESVILNEKTQIQKVDRVVLDSNSIAVIQKLSDQVQSALGDLVQISQKDIVNFLIQERSNELTDSEISKIKSEHFDIVRALKRATQEAIKAKQDGHEIQLDELLKIIQTPSVNKNQPSKKPRGRRKKVDGKPATHCEIDISCDHLERRESTIKRNHKISDTDSKIEKDYSNDKILVT